MSSEGSQSSGISTRSITYLTVLTAGIYFFRPWLHGLALALYTNPYIFEAVLISAIGVGIAAYRLKPSENTNLSLGVRRRKLIMSGIPILFLPLLIIGAPLSMAFEMQELSNTVEKNSNTLDKLPDIDPEKPRVLPKSVAQEYGSNSLQTPRYSLGSADIAISDKGEPYWSMGKEPDGVYNRFALRQEGAAFVDMTTQEKKIRYTDDLMSKGLGMGVTDNIMWHLKKQRYWIEYEDPVNIEHEGKNYIAVPYKDFNFHLTSSVAYTTPEWSGIALIDPEGNTQFLDREEAGNNKILEDQRLYPYDLAKKKVSSLAYKHGIINAWFTHRDQLEVADVPGTNNDQPFTILTEEGVKLFVAAEPFGEAQGLFQLWTIDAKTGEYSVLELNRSEALLGANKATNYVRKANSKVNWADRSSDQNTVQTGFKPSEPIPFVVNDRFYWQVRVVPLDSAGIAFTSFVDARSGDVINAETDRQITEFLQNENIEDGSVNRTETTQSSDGVWSIVLIENDEVVDRIEVTENQSVRFER